MEGRRRKRRRGGYEKAYLKSRVVVRETICRRFIRSTRRAVRRNRWAIGKREPTIEEKSPTIGRKISRQRKRVERLIASKFFQS